MAAIRLDVAPSGVEEWGAMVGTVGVAALLSRRILTGRLSGTPAKFFVATAIGLHFPCRLALRKESRNRGHLLAENAALLSGAVVSAVALRFADRLPREFFIFAPLSVGAATNYGILMFQPKDDPVQFFREFQNPTPTDVARMTKFNGDWEELALVVESWRKDHPLAYLAGISRLPERSGPKGFNWHDSALMNWRLALGSVSYEEITEDWNLRGVLEYFVLRELRSGPGSVWLHQSKCTYPRRVPDHARRWHLRWAWTRAVIDYGDIEGDSHIRSSLLRSFCPGAVLDKVREKDVPDDCGRDWAAREFRGLAKLLSRYLCYTQPLERVSLSREQAQTLLVRLGCHGRDGPHVAFELGLRIWQEHGDAQRTIGRFAEILDALMSKQEGHPFFVEGGDWARLAERHMQWVLERGWAGETITDEAVGVAAALLVCRTKPESWDKLASELTFTDGATKLGISILDLFPKDGPIRMYVHYVWGMCGVAREIPRKRTTIQHLRTALQSKHPKITAESLLPLPAMECLSGYLRHPKDVWSLCCTSRSSYSQLHRLLLLRLKAIET